MNWWPFFSQPTALFSYSLLSPNNRDPPLKLGNIPAWEPSLAQIKTCPGYLLFSMKPAKWFLLRWEQLSMTHYPDNPPQGRVRTKLESLEPWWTGEREIFQGRWACSTLLIHQFQGNSRTFSEEKKPKEELNLLCGVEFEWLAVEKT